MSGGEIKKKRKKMEMIGFVNPWKKCDNWKRKRKENKKTQNQTEHCLYLMVLFLWKSLIYWLNDIQWNWNNSVYTRDLPCLIASIESDSIFLAETNIGDGKNKWLFLYTEIKGRKQSKQLMALECRIIISRKPWPKDANLSQLTHCEGSLWSSCLS